MKRFLLLLTLLCALGAGVSCLSEIDSEKGFLTKTVERLAIEVEIDEEDTSTKAFYYPQGQTMRFSIGDSLSCYLGASPFIVKSLWERTFTISGEMYEYDGSRLFVYPYDAVKEYIEHDEALITVPDVQYTKANSFGSKANIAVALYSPGQKKMYLRNCLSYIRFDKTEDSPLWNAIEVEALGGEPLCGEFKVGADAVLLPTGNNSSKVRLDGETGFAFTLLGLPPGDYSQGLKVTFLYDEYPLFEKTIQPTTFRRSEIRSFGEVKQDSYRSTDKSRDGKYYRLQYASSDAVTLVLLGDGFSDRQIASGLYRHIMMQAYDAIFEESVMKELKPCVNVYYMDIVSGSEGLCNSSVFGNDGDPTSDNSKKVKEKVKKHLSITEKNTAICCISNTVAFMGRTFHYPGLFTKDGQGLTVSFCSLRNNRENFRCDVKHEAAGHGIGKLADEYVSYYSTIPKDVKSKLSTYHSYGWFTNVDVVSSASKVKWSALLDYDDFDSEGLGVYEGAYLYECGAYRCTDNSVMRYAKEGFNPASRRALYRRVMKAYKGSEYDDSVESYMEFERRLEKPQTGKKINIVPPDCLPDETHSMVVIPSGSL